jgi:hypothetical protein
MKGKISETAQKILNNRDASKELMNYITRGTSEKRCQVITVGSTQYEVSSGDSCVIEKSSSSKSL